jgi:MFS family permease
VARPAQIEILRRLAAPVYAPQIASAIGISMLVPVLPLYLTQQGLGFTQTSVVLAAAGLGGVIGSLPSGGLVARFGDRTLMMLALVIMALAAALVGFTTVVVALFALRLAIGAGAAGLRLANQTRITHSVEGAHRGRAMSLMGGSFRLANLVGPLVGGALVDLVGFKATFVVVGVVIGAGLVPATLHRPLPAAPGDSRRPVAAHRPGVLRALWRHRRLLARGGPGPALVMTVRSGRLVVVPLIGDQLGLSPTAVGALIAIGTGADLLLFPLAGHVMDRYGRLASMVPAFGLLGVGLFVLAAAETTSMVVVAGIIMGVGNGMSAGTMLTLASDLAPPEEPGPFLAAMSAMQDSGRIAGPLAVGWFADAAGLGTSAFVLAVAMFVGISWIVLVIGETAPHIRGQSGWW